MPEVGPITGLPDKIVAITLLATVTVHPGAATGISAQRSRKEMKTATLTIAFISVSPFPIEKLLGTEQADFRFPEY